MDKTAESFETLYRRLKPDLDKDNFKIMKIDPNDVAIEKKKSPTTPATLGLTAKYQPSKPLADVLDYITGDKIVITRQNEAFSKYPTNLPAPTSLEELKFDDNETERPKHEVSTTNRRNIQNVFGEHSNKEEEFDSIKLNPHEKFEWRILNKDPKPEFEKIQRLPLTAVFQNCLISDDDSIENTKDYRKGRKVAIEINKVEWQGALQPDVVLEVCIMDPNNLTQPKTSQSWRGTLTGGKSPKIIFDISSSHGEVFLLMKTYKAYEGDLSSWLDGYAKAKPGNDKSIEGYYQNLGWFPVFLFDENCLGESPAFGTVSNGATDLFYRFDDTKYPDDDIVSSCKFLRVKANAKKPKQVPVKLHYKIEELELDTVDKKAVLAEEFSLFSVISNREHVNHLYVWPISFNGAKANSNHRNFCVRVQLVSNDNLEDGSRILKTIYDGPEKNLDSFTTGVHHHKRTPFFSEEVKIGLPIPITEKHHLLFTFYHVSFKHRKDEEPSCYAFMKLLDYGMFVSNGEQKLPVCNELRSGYLNDKEESSKNWLDSKKQLFTLKVKLCSSFYSQDARHHTFHQKIQQASPDAENDLLGAVRDLVNIDPISLNRFWPVIINELIDTVCTQKFSDNVSKACFKGIVGLVASIHGDVQKRHPIVQEYTQSGFQRKSSWKIEAHEAFLKYWLALLQSNDSSCRDIAKYAWFFLDVITKSLVEFSLKPGKPAVPVFQRKDVVPSTVLDQVSELLKILSVDVNRLMKSGLNISKELNECISYFLIKLFMCCSVDYVFTQITLYNSALKIENASSVNIKLDFLRIVSSYEHTIALSLPTRSQVSSDRLNFSKFFFPHLLQSGVSEIITSDISNEELRTKALMLLFSVLAKHEMDSRCKELEAKKMVFGMYLPTIILLCDNLSRFDGSEMNKRKFSNAEARCFCACSLMILRYLENDVLVKWMDRESSIRCNAFLHALSAMQDLLKFSGKFSTESQNIDLLAPPKTSSDTKYIENAYKVGPSQSTNLRELRGTLRQEASKAKTGTLRGTRRGSVINGAQLDEDPIMGILHSYQSFEASVIVSSVLSHLLQVLKTQERRSSSYINVKDFERLFAVLKHVMLSPQPKTLLPSLLRLLGRSVVDFAKLFLKGSKLCADLSEILLRQLGSPFSEVRWMAAESTYILMRANLMETKSNIGKIKIQLTVAMSKTTAKIPENLKIGLYSVEFCSAMDTNAPRAFVKLVSDFVQGLVDILRDKFKVELSKDDPEMQEDMFFRLAKGYSNAPDLRIAILETLAAHHTTHGQHAEAAFCKLHCAALISEYLKLKGIDVGPFNAFEKISGNLLEEKSKAGDINPDEEGICQGPAFTENGYIEFLTNSMQSFKKAQLYELCVEACKLLLPLYERSKQYKLLATTHGEIKEFYESIMSSSGKRILATYYKVAFFGPKFGALDGQQFIYKEKTVTQLSEIVHRLTDTFTKKYGGNFELLTESKVNVASLSKDKAYVSIMHVEPYFTSDELATRTTYFDKMNCLTKFFFETPYTLSGKAHGEVENQYKRKTILTVEKPFPYFKKRLLITQIKELDLTPIEVSIEAISDRCDKLRAVISANPLNLKNLQLLLQGIVQPQVNRGPVEFASIFLDKSKGTKYPAEHVQTLGSKFKTLIDLCHKALHLSKMHSPEDQTEFNASLDDGYKAMKEKVESYLQDKPIHRETSGTISSIGFLKEEQSIIFDRDDNISLNSQQ